MSQTIAPPAPVSVNAEQGSRPPRRRRTVLLIVLLGIAAVALIYGVPAYLHSLHWESTDDAFIESSIVQVSPRVEGHVAKVLVEDNQPVEAGQVLVELDPADYQARLDAAEASLAAAQSGQTRAAATLAASQASAARATAEAVAAEAIESRSRTELQRVEELMRTSSASPQELTNAQSAQNVAVANLDAARKRAAAAEAEIAEARAGVQTAAAQVTQVEASLKQAELNVSYTTIRAPVAGRVTRKSVEAGQYLKVGQAAMALVPRDVWVVANFKETQLTHMRPGQEAQITIDAFPGVTLKGHVDSIQAGSGARFSLLPPENATGNFVKVVQRVPVKIVFDQQPDPAYPLGPGMSVVPDVKVK